MAIKIVYMTAAICEHVNAPENATKEDIFLLAQKQFATFCNYFGRMELVEIWDEETDTKVI